MMKNFNADGTPVIEHREDAYQGFMRDAREAAVARNRKILALEEYKLRKATMELDREIQKGARKKGFLRNLVARAKALAA